MNWEIAKNLLIDSLKDSAFVFLFVFLFHIILSLFEDKIANLITKKKTSGPLLGSILGIIPQCGTSVLGADLYIRKYISLGTLSAIFLSCSDEALILLLTHPNERTWMIIPLIISKFIIGFICGLVIDLIFKKQDILIREDEIHDVTCESHHHKDNFLHKHLYHPLFHSLEIFIYVFIINIILSFTIASIGEDVFLDFIISNKYLSPLFSSIIGLIPNCASSVFISTLFINNSISFGALVSGLLVNSGLGILILFKHKNYIRKGLLILSISFVISIVIGYLICLLFGF